MFKRRRFVLAVLFGVFASALLIGLALKTPVRGGDGLEYWYQVESLARHLSPELRDDDQQAVMLRFPDESALASDPDAAIDIPSPDPTGYATAPDGRRFGAHFWAYSLSAVPARWLLQLVGGHVMASLQLTNGIWFLAALFVVLFRWEVPISKKFLFVVLAFVGPPLDYLIYTGAETLSWSCAVLAMVALDQKKYARCSLFASLGAMQNPPLVLLGGIAVLLAIWQRRWKEMGLAMAAGLLSLLPMVFYTVHFGRPSLLLGDATSISNISLGRTLSMILDFNQGYLGYVPLFMTTVLIGVILGRSVTIFAVIAAVLGMALISEMQTNWNGGGLGIQRYLLWMMPPLAWVAAEGPGSRTRFGLGIAALLFHTPLWILFPPDRLSHLEQRPLARYILKQYPELYSPLFEIFIERQHNTEFSNPLHGLPAGFARPGGEVIKLLVVKGCERNFSQTMIVTPEYRPILFALIEAAEEPTYIYPPRWAVQTNPGALTGEFPNRVNSARPRWR